MRPSASAPVICQALGSAGKGVASAHSSDADAYLSE